VNNRTTVERTSDREVVITRLVNAPPRIVWQAWTRPELFTQWWIPKTAPMTLVSCEMDVRVGGSYRLVFLYQGNEMAFFGKYREVVPDARLVWTNDEAGDAGQISTATFEEKAGRTLVVMHELYPSKEALDAAIASGSQEGMQEAFDQLDEFVTPRA
jgi:uncharacterized protein YndB with AHSA1/START domain